jgi:hypothetical protein
MLHDIAILRRKHSGDDGSDGVSSWAGLDDHGGAKEGSKMGAPTG